jgi:hypothetical protein
VESLQFDFGIIRDATENFSDANKLGKGGFGTIYKVMWFFFFFLVIYLFLFLYQVFVKHVK